MQLPSSKELREKHPFRDHQINQLASLLNPAFPSPPALVVHGFSSSETSSSSKSSLVVDILKSLEIKHATVKCAETITQRHLLQRILQACSAAISDAEGAETLDSADSRCENLSGLVVQLQSLLGTRDGKFVLVLDEIDRQRENGPTLFPTLARLGEIISTLSTILITSTPRPLPFHRPGVPYIHFPPYSRAEAITLVSRTPPSPTPDSLSPILTNPTTLSKFYTLFTTAVYDSLVCPTSGSSIPLLSKTCLKLWPRFIAPLLESEPPPGKSTEWDFPKLFVRNRSLFQSEGEALLVPSFLSSNPSSHKPHPPTTRTTSSSSNTQCRAKQHPLLKYTPTILLLAAYLASHTSPKLDILLFSRLSSQSSTNAKARRVKKSYHRKKLNFTTTTGGTASSSGPPSKSRNNHDPSAADLDLDTPAAAAEASTTKKRSSKASSASAKDTTRVGKSIWSLRAAIPHPFGLDRLFSIFRAVHPHGIPTSGGGGGSQPTGSGRSRHASIADTCMVALVELSRLRLVVPVVGGGGGVAGGGGDDFGDEAGGGGGGGRWRVNVRREFVEERCREWGIGDGDGGVGAIGEWEI